MIISDKIELACIVITAITSVAAIIISVFTLRQNSKMIEDSSRPYIGIYLSSTYIRNVSVYLIVKNYGQSSAFIESFTYDFDLANCSSHNIPDREPFQNIENATLMPGQSHRCVIDLNKTLKQTDQINFHVVYSSGAHKSEDDICVNLAATIGNFASHNTTKGKETEIISETLQDMLIHSL